MKRIIFLIAIISMFGCEKSTSQKDMSGYNLPPELQDCKTYTISNGWSNMYVMRCPNSTTAVDYQKGKVRETVITIDGVEYVKK